MAKAKRLRVWILEKVLECLLIEDNDEAGDEFDHHIREFMCLQAEYYHREKQRTVDECIAFYNNYPDSFVISEMHSIRMHDIDYGYTDDAITSLMAIIIWLYNLKDWDLI